MGRNNDNRVQTIQHIKITFIDIYSQNGIDGISVQYLCEKAGISRTIFYKYFEDKYAVLENIESELLLEISRINASLLHAPLHQYREGMFPVFSDTAKYIYEQRLFIKPLLGPKGDSYFIHRWKKLICKQVGEKFLYDKVVMDNINVITEMFASAIIGLYTHWFYENQNLSYEEISEIAGKYLCGSLYMLK